MKIIQIHGSGTTNPSKLFWWAMDKLEERAGSPVRLTYRSVGSGTGKADWADHANNGDPDFASTDFGLEPDTAKPFLQIPFQIGAVSVFVNLPGVKTGTLSSRPVPWRRYSTVTSRLGTTPRSRLTVV